MCPTRDRKSTRLNSSHVSISYAVFCLKKKNRTIRIPSADNERGRYQQAIHTRQTTHQVLTAKYQSTLTCYTIPSTRYSFFFFFNDTATTEIYTLSLHDALPISSGPLRFSTTVTLRLRRPCGA